MVKCFLIFIFIVVSCRNFAPDSFKADKSDTSSTENFPANDKKKEVELPPTPKPELIPSAKSGLGANLGNLQDWGGAYPWVNLFKVSRDVVNKDWKDRFSGFTFDEDSNGYRD